MHVVATLNTNTHIHKMWSGRLRRSAILHGARFHLQKDGSYMADHFPPGTLDKILTDPMIKVVSMSNDTVEGRQTMGIPSPTQNPMKPIENDPVDNPPTVDDGPVGQQAPMQDTENEHFAPDSIPLGQQAPNKPYEVREKPEGDVWTVDHEETETATAQEDTGEIPNDPGVGPLSEVREEQEEMNTEDEAQTGDDNPSDELEKLLASNNVDTATTNPSSGAKRGRKPKAK